MKKNVWSVMGFLVGVIAVVVGVVFLLDTHGTYIGQSYTFGADFYTEIYGVTKNLGHAINNTHLDFMKGFGWLFILGGLIDICVFGSKIERKKKNVKDTAFEVELTKEQ